MDDRLLAALGIDTRYVWPTSLPTSPVHPTANPNVLADSFGQPWIRAFPYYYSDTGILRDRDIDDIDRIVSWPDTGDPRWTATVRERARDIYEGTDCFIVGRMVTSHGPFQMACDLRSTDQFLMDLALNPDFAHALLARITDTVDGLLRGYLEAGGPFFDMVELPGDDYASNDNTLMSLRTFREFFKPHLRRLVETVKSYRADLPVMFHSDGMIASLLPELIEIGVDVVHPLEPVPRMDLAQIKADYGHRLAFLGAIDISHAMNATVADVELEARTRIQQLAPGGGYILAPSNHLQPDVPPENVIALFDAARRYGRYPLTSALADQLPPPGPT
jgi:uroporphyrinogen decarboxylase